MFKFIIPVLLLFASFEEGFSRCSESRLYETCDFAQPMSPYVAYYVYNLEYDNKYRGRQSCRWAAEAPDGYSIKMNCSIDIPASKSCVDDSLSISMSGDPNLADGRKYCGKGTFIISSWDKRMTIALSAPATTKGGTFLCKLIATPQDCNCGWKKTNRIVGGFEAGINQFPMSAGLVDRRATKFVFIFCGGTIISRRFIITAAHCCINRNSDNTEVRVGEHDTTITTETQVTQVRRIQYLQQHERFNTTTQQNDIALVRLTEDILYSGLVGPACLPFKYQNSDFTGVNCTAMGWGATEYGGPLSPVLKDTTLIVQSPGICDTYYPGRIANTQFCTYAQGTDTCQSDSGGGLVWIDPSSESYNVLAITSYGKIGCATPNPAVNTNVAKFIPWIVDNTQTAYCQK